RLHHQQNKLRRFLTHNASVILQDSPLDILQRRSRCIAITDNQIERDLNIKNSLEQLLEREQVHCLLVQFVHSELAVFRNKLKDGGYHAPYLSCFTCPKDQEGQHHSRRMSRHRRSRLEFQLL